MLLFYGDPQGEFQELFSFIEINGLSNIEGIFFLGDICPDIALEDILGAEVAEKTWFILGEKDAQRQEWMENLLCMWDRNLHAKIVGVGGYLIAGLGGVFRSEVWHPETGSIWDSRQQLRDITPARSKFRDWLPLKHWSSIFLEDYQHLLSLEQADVLLSHEAPSTHKLGFWEVDELAFMLETEWIFHGHHDCSYLQHLESEEGNVIQVIGLGRQDIHILV